jgi:hypothetical protein
MAACEHCQYKLSLECDLGSPHAAAPLLLEATVDAGT